MRVRAALPACRGPLSSGAAARAPGERQPPLGVCAAGGRRSQSCRQRRRARADRCCCCRPSEPTDRTAAACRRPRQALPRATQGGVRQGAGGPRRRRGRPGDPSGRDARTRRRVRVGEVDSRPSRRRAAATDGRDGRVRRRRPGAPRPPADAGAAPRRAGRVPGSVRGAQPAPPRGVDHRRPVGHPRHAEGGDRRPGRRS